MASMWRCGRWEGGWRPSPLAMLPWCNFQKTSASREGSFLASSGANFCCVRMRIEDFLVILGILQLMVARLKESLVGWHAVAGPLPHYGGEKCTAKEICKDYVAGAAAGEPWGGRGTPFRSRVLEGYNPTRGYPGQDITSCLTH